MNAAVNNPVLESMVPTIHSAVDWALQHHLAMKVSASDMRHTAFSLTPATITQASFERLKDAAGAMGKLIHAVSEDQDFLREVIAPVAQSEPFLSRAAQYAVGDLPRGRCCSNAAVVDAQ